MKKTVSLILALLMFVTMLSVSVYAQDTTDELITKSDIQLLASDFVLANIKGNDDSTWNTDMRASETPLYDVNDKIVAYYVAFDNVDGNPNGYLVVNASKQNPSVLEYAFNTPHDDIVVGQKNYYSTCGLYFTKSQSKSKEEQFVTSTGITFPYPNVKSANDIWESINTPNSAAAKKLSTLQNYANKNVRVFSEINTRATDSWGISTSLPSGSWTASDTLTSCSLGVPYHTTSSLANGNSSYTNHCGSTAAMNVLKYYGARLNSNFTVPSVASAFSFLYTNTGNGGATLPPKLRTALSSYITNRKNAGSLSSNVNITTSQYTEFASYYSNLVSCINNGKMPLLMIWSSAGAHWVNVVAYYTYSNGNAYVRIIDNWHTDINRYYVFQTQHTVNGSIGGMISVKITK